MRRLAVKEAAAVGGFDVCIRSSALPNGGYLPSRGREMPTKFIERYALAVACDCTSRPSTALIAVSANGDGRTVGMPLAVNTDANWFGQDRKPSAATRATEEVPGTPSQRMGTDADRLQLAWPHVLPQ